MVPSLKIVCLMPQCPKPHMTLDALLHLTSHHMFSLKTPLRDNQLQIINPKLGVRSSLQ